MNATVMQALFDRAVIRCQDRTISYTWLGEQNPDGESQGIRLSITHNKTRKQLTATFYRFVREQRAGYAMERHEMWIGGSGESNSRQYAATACPRYSDKALATFDSTVREMLVQDPHPCERFVGLAGVLTGIRLAAEAVATLGVAE